MTQPNALPDGLKLASSLTDEQAAVLTPEALAFVAELQRRFNPRRLELLAAREERQARLDAGEKPDFLAETESVRGGDWKVVPPKADLNRPPGGDHRPGGPQDDHQRAQFRRKGLHGRL